MWNSPRRKVKRPTSEGICPTRGQITAPNPAMDCSHQSSGVCQNEIKPRARVDGSQFSTFSSPFPSPQLEESFAAAKHNKAEFFHRLSLSPWCVPLSPRVRCDETQRKRKQGEFWSDNKAADISTWPKARQGNRKRENSRSSVGNFPFLRCTFWAATNSTETLIWFAFNIEKASLSNFSHALSALDEIFSSTFHIKNSRL